MLQVYVLSKVRMFYINLPCKILIFQKLEYWDEHVCLCAENMRDNLKILHKALKENKISLMVHNVSRNFINDTKQENYAFCCDLVSN